VISAAHPVLPLGTVMMPAIGYPGFAPARKTRRRMREADDEI